MIKLQGKLPRKLYLACSGGVDSMAALDFLRRNHQVQVLHFNHNTAHGNKAEDFVGEYCMTHNIPCVHGNTDKIVPEGRSKEDFWREERYKFLDSYITAPVVTVHHLDDCVETWIWSSLNGVGKIVNYHRGNIIRPFRLARKRDLQLWAHLQNVPYIEDDSNADLCYTRNYIRHTMMPHVLAVNPGIHKVIKKKVLDDAPTN